MVTGMRCRAMARRWPAVQTRCEPQITIGRIGRLARHRHPHGAALEGQQLERPRDGRLGEDPDDLALRGGRAPRRGRPRRPASRSTGMCFMPRISGPATGCLEDALLGHEPDEPLRRVRGQPGEGEVQPAGVVDGHDGAALARDVLGAGDGELQPQADEGHAGGSDHRGIDPIRHRRLSPPRPYGLRARRPPARRAGRRGRSCARAARSARRRSRSPRPGRPGRRTPRAAPSARPGGGAADGRRYCVIVTRSQPAACRSLQRLDDLVDGLAHAEDEVGLRDQPGGAGLGDDVERALVAEARADPLEDARDRLDVVRQHLGPGAEDRVELVGHGR